MNHYKLEGGTKMEFTYYIQALIDFIMKLIAFFKKSDNTETEE